MKILVPVAALVMCAMVPLVLEHPVVVLAGSLCLAAALWLWAQGPFRAAYAITLVTMLAATSSLSWLAGAATYARLGAVAVLVVVTWATTAAQPPIRLSGAAAWMVIGLAVLAVWSGVSIVWSVAPLETAVQAVLFSGLVAILHRLVTRRWFDPGLRHGDLRVAAVTVGVYTSIGVVAHVLGALPDTFSGRAQGLFNNPNLAAMIGVLLLFVSWGLYLERKSAAMLTVVLSGASMVILTESRAGLVAVLVGVGWTALRGGRRIFLVLVPALGLVGVVAAPLWLPVVGRFGDVAAGDAFAGRSLGWATAVDLIAERPVGYGWGSTQQTLASAYASGASHFRPESIHNSYLQVAFELNVVGFLVLLVVLLGVGALILRRPRGGLDLGLSATLLAGFVIHFSESPMFGMGQPYPWIYWFAAAGLAATHHGVVPAPASSDSQKVGDGGTSQAARSSFACRSSDRRSHARIGT